MISNNKTNAHYIIAKWQCNAIELFHLLDNNLIPSATIVDSFLDLHNDSTCIVTVKNNRKIPCSFSNPSFDFSIDSKMYKKCWWITRSFELKILFHKYLSTEIMPSIEEAEWISKVLEVVKEAKINSTDIGDLDQKHEGTDPAYSGNHDTPESIISEQEAKTDNVHGAVIPNTRVKSPQKIESSSTPSSKVAKPKGRNEDNSRDYNLHNQSKPMRRNNGIDNVSTKSSKSKWNPERDVLLHRLISSNSSCKNSLKGGIKSDLSMMKVAHTINEETIENKPKLSTHANYRLSRKGSKPVNNQPAKVTSQDCVERVNHLRNFPAKPFSTEDDELIMARVSAIKKEPKATSNRKRALTADLSDKFEFPYGFWTELGIELGCHRHSAFYRWKMISRTSDPTAPPKSKRKVS